MAPEFPCALGLVVVDDDEVADALVLERDLPVIALDVRLPELAIREELPQQHDAALDEVYARGFQRLEEPGREPDGNTVLDPGPAPPPRRESQGQRVTQRPSLDTRHQLLLC